MIRVVHPGSGFIPDPDPDPDPDILRIPDAGVKKVPDPEFGSATQVICSGKLKNVYSFPKDTDPPAERPDAP